MPVTQSLIEQKISHSDPLAQPGLSSSMVLIDEDAPIVTIAENMRDEFRIGEQAGHTYLAYNSKARFATWKDDEAHPLDQKLRAMHQHDDLINEFGITGQVYTNNTEEALELLITFRGTKDLGGVWRDIAEDQHIGSQSFEKHQAAIAKAFKALLGSLTNLMGNTEKPIHLRVSGHSLGTVDTQLFVGLVIKALAKKKDEELKQPDTAPIQKINKITMDLQNGVGIPKEMAGEIHAAFADCKDLTVQANVTTVDNDIVQQAGEQMLFIAPCYFNTQKNYAFAWRKCLSLQPLMAAAGKILI